MKISVGVNVGHDASIAVLNYENDARGNLVVYEAERFSKIKHQEYFPIQAIPQIMAEVKDVWKTPSHNFAICCNEIGTTVKESLFIQKKDYTQALKNLRAENFSKILNNNITDISHHLCHAYSALYFSPYEEAIIVVADGVGSNGDVYKESLNDYSADEQPEKVTKKNFESISIYHQKNGSLTLIEKRWGEYLPYLQPDIFLNHGLGSYYTAAANYIFANWHEAGKVMGLSAFGENQCQDDKLFEYLESEFKKERNIYKGQKLFNEQPKNDFKRSADIAKTLQHYFEKQMISLVKKLKEDFPSIENLILTGGCALNCLTNSILVNNKIFKNIYIPPCPNDEGISLGAAYYKSLNSGFTKFTPYPIQDQNPFLGSQRIVTELENHNKIKEVFNDYEVSYQVDPTQRAAELICDGELIAWFQGRSECGPRALGNRSILGLPSKPGLKNYLNQYIKCREDFRPYGCSVTKEDAHRYFESPKNYEMPYMSFAPKVIEQQKHLLTQVTHLDNTCRIQTVSREQNLLYYQLIKKIEGISGHPLVLNTSLNIMGQPILESIKDAHAFFQSSKIKHLFLGNLYISK